MTTHKISSSRSSSSCHLLLLQLPKNGTSCQGSSDVCQHFVQRATGSKVCIFFAQGQQQQQQAKAGGGSWHRNVFCVPRAEASKLALNYVRGEEGLDRQVRAMGNMHAVHLRLPAATAAAAQEFQWSRHGNSNNTCASHRSRRP